MTVKEYATKTHPEAVCEDCIAGMAGCPSDYSEKLMDMCVCYRGCDFCWNQELT